MDNNIRLQYLEAMGIESWYPKNFTALETDDVPVAVTMREPTPTAQVKPEETRAIAVETDNWTLLEQQVSACQQCVLSKTRTQTVFGAGNKNADWMFIGEDPDEQEDRQGQPFVDNIGLLLTEMMRALGLKKEEVFITNVLKCRPPDDRAVKVDELTACHDYLIRQKALVKPKIIVAVGRVAAQHLLKTRKPLKELRDIVHQVDNTPLIVVYHPAYLLRSLTQKRAAWQDLQLALKTYQHL